jgi:NitT/TauT family transport system ATP-binding protein
MDAGAACDLPHGTGIQISGSPSRSRCAAALAAGAAGHRPAHRQGLVPRPARPSGCGKSTILRILAALDHPTDGVALVGRDDARPRALPACANIELPFEVAGRKVDRGYVDELIGLVGLRDFADAKPAQLSGGMRQRASIARASS